MTSPFNSFIADGVDQCWYGLNDSVSMLKGALPTAPANGNQDGSLMARIRGVVGADIGIPQPDVQDVPGDNGSQGSFLTASVANPAFTLEQAVFDMQQQAKFQNTKTLDEGGFRLGVLKPVTFANVDVFMVLSSPSKKKDIGVGGVKAWSGYFVPIVNAAPIGRAQFQTKQVANDRYRCVTNPADILPNGLAIDATNFNTEGGCVVPYTADWPAVFQRHSGDGTEVEFNFGILPAEYSATNIVIRVNGVLQVYGTAYVASAGVITFQSGHVPTAGAKIVTLFGYDPNHLAA